MDFKRFLEIWEMTKYGWDQTAWFFLMLGSSAVIGSIFGITGTIAVLATMGIFYYIGKTHKRLTEAKKPQEQPSSQ